MNYDDFRTYLIIMKTSGADDIQIHWPVIDIGGVEAQDHGSRFGLQLADLAVSGLRAALECDRYGNVEPRFAKILQPMVYSRRGNYLSYGAKLVPNYDAINAFKDPDVTSVDLTPWRQVFE